MSEPTPLSLITSRLKATPASTVVSETAAAAVVSVLNEAGVDRIFGIPGGTISPVVDACLDGAGPEFVSCQHETMAVYAAMGYARSTGQPGVVAVTSGPGALNALTGLSASRLDETPLILLVGEVATTSRGRAALQDGSLHGIDLHQVASSLAKESLIIERPWVARALTSEAIRRATSRPYGPAVIRIPVDVAGQRAPRTKVSLASGIHPSIPPADLSADIVQHLRAERTAIMLGGRAYQAGARGVVRALAERLRCPVFTDLEAKGLFPESHPLSLGVFGVGSAGRAEAYLQDGVDTLLIVGARLDDTTTANFSELIRPAGGVVIQVDYDADRLGRSYPVDYALAGDPRVILDHVLRQLPEPLDVSPPLTIAPPDHRPLQDAPFDPRGVPAVLQQALPNDTIFTSDIGNHLVFAAQGLRLDTPGRFHASLGLGGMGSGIGMAIGIAMGAPHSRVVGICGDGGLLMAGNELATCARHDVPVTFAVFDDGQWGMVAHGSQKVYGRSHDWSLPVIDIVGYARSLGANAIRVTTEDELRDALQRSQKGTWVIDIPIDPTVRIVNPRDETLNFGTRDESLN
ncbi:MAG: thiamine pyrophosphate-binding protein [Deltaproteobacteria bacterium]|nr:thiamine pyrophosphate-binding protein [Deltaproteobacteria bacterium]